MSDVTRSGSRIDLPFDQLAAPTQDGAVLIHPATTQWPQLIEQNQRRRAAWHFEIAGKSVADSWTQRDTPLLYTGHQPEFIHPGVWVKNVLAARMAERLGGHAIFLAVDNDAPETISIRVPTERDGAPTTATLLLDRNADGLAYESLAAPSRDAAAHFFHEVAQHCSRWPNDLPRFAAAFSNADKSSDSRATGNDYVDHWLGAISAFDRSLDIPTPQWHRNSRMGNVPSISNVTWNEFAFHLVHDADRFAACYNRALADYRTAKKMRGTQHPMPDLQIEPDRVELPFWLYRHGEKRRRMFVGRGALRGALFAETSLAGHWHKVDDVSPDGVSRWDAPAIATTEVTAPWLVRPRALALTLYARLFVSDFFVHGIGGAKYDAVTDAIIRAYFNIQAPAYACATATLRLPLQRHDVSPKSLRELRRRQRTAMYNPQQLVADPADETLAALIAARQKAVAASNAQREQANADRSQRRHLTAQRHATFNEIRSLSARIAAAAGITPADYSSAIEQTRRQLADNRVADNREWFYALYPREKLLALSETLQSV